ncbi:hypothetical protein [Erwinia sp. E_sp_B04_7]|uniref:hypothetical protein n=1 Tax=unclassified Erwinia TaxID=2622719 RepID=UPI0030CF2393
MADKQFTQTRSEFIHLSHLTPVMDFLDLAEYNERLVSVLVESDNNEERLAICLQMAACLAQLQTALNEPVPESRIAQLTTEDETVFWSSSFIAEPETVTLYCRALTQALLSRVLSPEIEEAFRGLLFDLVSFQVDDLKAPRFVQTESGLEHIR